MTANTSPIFTKTPDLTWPSATNGSVVVSATNQSTLVNAYDGTSGTVLIYTAGIYGSFVQKLVCEAGGTNVASVLRVHVNNGTSPTNASANSLYMQYSLPATTAISTAATAHIEIPLMLQLPASYRVYVSIGCTANLVGGWYVTAVAGDY